MNETLLVHKRGFVIFANTFLVFLGCFAFPVYNFSKDAPEISIWSGFAVPLIGYFEIGWLLGKLYDKKMVRKTAGMAFLLTPVGFLCRFLLEYGEVSNSYNFIWPNVVLHLLTAIALSVFGAISAGKDQRIQDSVG